MALLLLLFAVGCQAGGNGSQTETKSSDNELSEKTETVETTETSAETESALPDTHEAFLDTVTYLNYELTGESTPCYIGRWFEKEIDGTPHMVTLTDGATMYFLINGAATFTIEHTVITGNDIPYYACSIDGNTPERKLITDNVVTLPDSGRHTVRIIADGVTESVGKWADEKGVAFRGITPSDGGEILGIRPKNKVIFFYGDSITEGICAIGNGYTSRNNSATNAYPWFCSEALGTVPYYIGYGGSGIISVGSFRPMIDAIRYNSYNRPTIDTAKPDIIVINHGTNDGSKVDSAMKTRLEETIATLRESYPDVPIVYMIPFIQYKANVIASVMKEVPNSYVVQTSDWNVSTNNDGCHPNTAGAQKAGKKLAEELRSIFGDDFFS